MVLEGVKKVLLAIMVIMMLFSVVGLDIAVYAEEDKEESSEEDSKKESKGGSMPAPSIDDGKYTKEMCIAGGYAAKYSRDANTTEAGASYHSVESMNQKVMKETWDGLIERGFDEVHAAGIMGNIAYESVFNPASIEGGNNIGRGLVQWSFERRTSLENFAKEKGKDVDSVGLQLDFLAHEFKGPYKSVLKNLKETDNVQDAAYIFLSQFEKPRADVAKSACRYVVGNEIYEHFSGSKATPGDGEGSETPDEGLSTEGNNGRGEYTGNLEYDPFQDGGVVTKSTGIQDGNQDSIQSQETYVVSQWIEWIVFGVMLLVSIFIAAYMVLMAVVVLLLSFTNSYISDNKIIRGLLGAEFVDRMVGEGVKGVFWQMMAKFLIGSVILILAITGMVNGLQYILMEFVVKILQAVGL